MRLTPASARIVPDIVVQHVEEAIALHSVRTALTSAPHVKLHHLDRFDRRLDAHLDGLTLAGDYGRRLCDSALEDARASVLFVATVRAIEEDKEGRFERLLSVLEATPQVRAGAISAFGWVAGDRLKGKVAALLDSPSWIRRYIGVAACSVHRVSPRLGERNWRDEESSAVRARVARCIGMLGRRELVPECLTMLNADDPAIRFWAAWSAVMAGDRNRALAELRSTAVRPGAERTLALRLWLQGVATGEANALLQAIRNGAHTPALLIESAGVVGDPAYVPWLIRQMADEQTARRSGEAFSLITGADLALFDLERKPPENFESGPNDDPDDPNVEMDPDDGLPWPDSDRVQKWWDANKHRFQPGQRYFMGAPLTREHCIDVLKNGYQRQRILAAHYLCLLNPGTPLFNTSAPAWRQHKLLAEMK
jgi:uncharacterized protein (TIGR02270 family)